MQYDLEADRRQQIIFRRMENNSCRAHMHQSIELVFVLAGGFRVRINGEDFLLNAGDIAYCDSYRTHIYDCLGESVIYLLIVPTAHLREFEGSDNLTFQPVLPGARSVCPELFTLLDRAHDDWDDYNNLMRFGFVQYVYGLLSRHFTPHPRATNRRDDLLVKVLWDIENRYMEDLRLEELAVRYGYSYHYFSALFNHYIGQGFREYLNGVRIRHVQEILSKAGISVRAASEMCGFSNANTYYRAIRKAKKES